MTGSPQARIVSGQLWSLHEGEALCHFVAPYLIVMIPVV